MYRHPSGGVNKCALHNIYSLFFLSAASQECFCLRDFTDMTSAELRDVRSAKAFCLITAVRVESEAVETLWLIFFTFIKQEVLKITFITFLVRL